MNERSGLLLHCLADNIIAQSTIRPRWCEWQSISCRRPWTIPNPLTYLAPSPATSSEPNDWKFIFPSRLINTTTACTAAGCDDNADDFFHFFVTPRERGSLAWPGWQLDFWSRAQAARIKGICICHTKETRRRFFRRKNK